MMILETYSRSTTLAIIFAATIFVGTRDVFCQSDEARQASGLPTFIGPRPGTNASGANSSVSGTLTVQGLAEEGTVPNFMVTVLANGSFLSRQTVKNRGGFAFDGLPNSGITLVVEADGVEIARYQMQQLNPPPLPNRQDIMLSWLQVSKNVKQNGGVISLADSYNRNDENRKLFEKAMSEFRDKKYDNSIKVFKEILVADPKDFVVWTELGNAYFFTEKHTESEKAYNNAVAQKTDFLPALTNLGKLFLQQKKFDNSIETLSKALALNPNSADLNHFLGEAYLQSKKGSKAVSYLYEAIRIAPIEKAEIHLRLAALYNAAGAKDRAVAEYKSFLQKIPDHAERKNFEKYIRENSPKH